MKLHLTSRFIFHTEVHKTYDPTRTNKNFLSTPRLVSSVHTLETQISKLTYQTVGLTIAPPPPGLYLSIFMRFKGFCLFISVRNTNWKDFTRITQRKASNKTDCEHVTNINFQIFFFAYGRRTSLITNITQRCKEIV
jgi:hypothetical protein